MVLDALKKAGSVTKPRNLPFASLGGLFAGRDEDLADLHTALLGAKGAPVALCGLGGIGKTRLAIEYAGLARRSIRRFCSSARATAPRSIRVWRG